MDTDEVHSGPINPIKICTFFDERSPNNRDVNVRRMQEMWERFPNLIGLDGDDWSRRWRIALPMHEHMLKWVVVRDVRKHLTSGGGGRVASAFRGHLHMQNKATM